LSSSSCWPVERGSVLVRPPRVVDSIWSRDESRAVEVSRLDRVVVIALSSSVTRP
jgi:hypothetical protein